MIGNDERLILFDGVCNYCNAMVNFAIKNDKKGILKFAPLQSEAGKRLKEEHKIAPGVDSVIYIENGKVYTHSDAAIRIAKYLQWPAKAFYGFIIVPRFIRQPFYKWIARNRYKWFGKKDECMVPTKEVRERFLP
ncbi:MAG: thiol-disulfide oxidoreductase DCC family protein [Chitinophagaceae bacterium]